MRKHSRYGNNSSVVHDQDDSDTTSETAVGSPLSGDDTSLANPLSPTKRNSGKRVVTVPFDADIYPPADSWAWRKYGQKPIKGSPYPRGYYRCSSSKGCPARKQVERSRKDPTIVVITYVCEHNHLVRATKNSPNTLITTIIPAKSPPQELAVLADQTDFEPENMDFSDFFPEFGYFSNITSVILESPVTTNFRCTEPEVKLMFTRGDEEDSLFADLGELPGCSLIS